VSNASGFALAVNGRVLIHGDIGTFHGAWASAIERALTK
jgi:hypothetical protein